jgi:hypothetical protein
MGSPILRTTMVPPSDAGPCGGSDRGSYAPGIPKRSEVAVAAGICRGFRKTNMKPQEWVIGNGGSSSL